MNCNRPPSPPPSYPLFLASFLMLFGIFSYGIASPRVGVKHGNFILDLEVVGLLGYFDGIDLDPAVFARPVLNDFIEQGKPIWQAVQRRLTNLLQDEHHSFASVHDQVFIHQSRATMHLPIRIGDYTDFYAGIEHATNVGKMFRPDGDPLLPNYRHLPVAYHGRSSSIVVSGTPIHRPNGQYLQDNKPVFGPSKAIDFELEIGLIIGKNTALGEAVPVDQAEDCIFGITLFNDWSARDIQRWEYQPLGPFLAKNFGSTMSAWVLLFSELAVYRIPGPKQEPTPLPYLQASNAGHFAIELEVLLNDVVISRSNARHLYWSFAQMIAHHTVNGCNLKVGDVLATGTISGPTTESYGSLLELTWNGKQPLTLPDGTHRTFLQDGDTVTLRGWATGSDGQTIELGDAVGQLFN